MVDLIRLLETFCRAEHWFHKGALKISTKTIECKNFAGKWKSAFGSGRKIDKKYCRLQMQLKNNLRFFFQKLVTGLNTKSAVEKKLVVLRWSFSGLRYQIRKNDLKHTSKLSAFFSYFNLDAVKKLARQIPPRCLSSFPMTCSHARAHMYVYTHFQKTAPTKAF